MTVSCIAMSFTRLAESEKNLQFRDLLESPRWCKHSKINEEWEEAWEEYFVKDGMSKRWSKKWGKRGVQVWHENWGDELDANGNGSLWTDKATISTPFHLTGV